jgi:hypothetical protein
VRLTTRVVRLFFDRAREFTGFPPPGLQRLIATTEYGSASLVGYAINCFDDICPSWPAAPACCGAYRGTCRHPPMELLARASLTG